MRQAITVVLLIAVARAAAQVPAAAQSSPNAAHNQFATIQATVAASNAQTDAMAGNVALAQLDAADAQAAAGSAPGDIQAQVAAAQAQMDAFEAQQNADASSMAQPPSPSAPLPLRASHGWVFAVVAAVGTAVVLALVAHSHAPAFATLPRPAGL